MFWLLSLKHYHILSLLILTEIVRNYNKRRRSIQPEMLKRLMLISIEGHSVADFDAQYAFNRWLSLLILTEIMIMTSLINKLTYT
jgi:hypothetical protein